MKQQELMETVVGFLVICIAAFSFTFFYRVSNEAKDSDGYVINAYFQNTDGLVKGNDVKMSGIKIGYIDSLTLEQDTYMSVAKLKINKTVIIPADSRAIVSTNGIIGSKYVRIEPGAADENLKENSKVKFTQPALNLEDLIGKLIYSFTTK